MEKLQDMATKVIITITDLTAMSAMNTKKNMMRTAQEVDVYRIHMMDTSAITDH